MANNSRLIITRVLFWSCVVVVMGALLFVVNMRLFKPAEYPSARVSAQLDFPLSRVTVDLNEDGIDNIINTSTWIKCSSFAMGARNSVKLVPKNAESIEKFRTIVNRNGYAERLDSLYTDEGFEWEASENSLTLPVQTMTVENGNKRKKVRYIPVPTWILYELVPAE